MMFCVRVHCRTFWMRHNSRASFASTASITRTGWRAQRWLWLAGAGAAPWVLAPRRWLAGWLAGCLPGWLAAGCLAVPGALLVGWLPACSWLAGCWLLAVIAPHKV